MTRKFSLMILLLAVGCRAPTGMGRVQVYLAGDGRDVRGVRRLVMELESVGLHPAGMPVEEAWRTWPVHRQVDFVVLAAGAREFIGEVDAPAGRYDRVRVLVTRARAQGAAGEEIPVRVTVEPIAAPFDLKNGEMVAITIELISLGTPQEGFELFTKDAQVRKEFEGGAENP